MAGRRGWIISPNSLLSTRHTATNARHFPLPENNGIPPFLRVPFNHLLLAIWPSPIIETQAVVLGYVADTHANPKDGSGPAVRGYLQHSKLTLWWTNQKKVGGGGGHAVVQQHLLDQNGSSASQVPTGSCESHHVSKVVPNQGIKPKEVSVETARKMGAEDFEQSCQQLLPKYCA